MSAILAWLSSKGVSLLLSFIARFLLDMWKTYQANEAQHDAGKSEVEAAQAQAGKATSDAIANAAAKTLDEDDALGRLKAGSA